MLTKKDFKAVVEIMKSEYTRYDNTGEDDGEGKDTVGCIAGKLSDYFTTQNPRFDRERFMKACGLSS